MSLQKTFEDIEYERAHQLERWGIMNDDRNTLGDWVSHIHRYFPRLGRDASPTEQRRRMVQVAALAFAAVESFDRNRGFPVPLVREAVHA